MRTDNDLGKLSLSGLLEADDENQEKSLRWLLEMDLSEPEEKLLTVAGNDYFDTGLSAFEKEVAGRPLIRGNAHGDDLASYVGEEIVISSDRAAGDIYGQRNQLAGDEPTRNKREEVMALDFSRVREQPDRAGDRLLRPIGGEIGEIPLVRGIEGFLALGLEPLGAGLLHGEAGGDRGAIGANGDASGEAHGKCKPEGFHRNFHDGLGKGCSSFFNCSPA